MNETAEHHMRHEAELMGDRRPDMGMIIAMTGGPPACDTVHKLAAIGQYDARTFGG